MRTFLCSCAGAAQLASVAGNESEIRNFLVSWMFAYLEQQGTSNYVFSDSITPESIRQYGFTADGLMIIYSPYEIASYSAGSFEFTVSYAELWPYLNEYGQEALGVVAGSAP